MPNSQNKIPKTSNETAFTLIETLAAVLVLTTGLAGGLLFLNQINTNLDEAASAREIERLLDAGERYARSYWGLLQQFPQIPPGTSISGLDRNKVWIQTNALPILRPGVDQLLPFLPQSGQTPDIVTLNGCRVFASSVSGFENYRLLLIRHPETADPDKIQRIDVVLSLVSPQTKNSVEDNANAVLRRLVEYNTDNPPRPANNPPNWNSAFSNQPRCITSGQNFVPHFAIIRPVQPWRPWQ